ncbi:MAG: hypothetical protein N2253_02065 [Bacteroidia bacterium]|nr:hypothetical protein [Bacteroidia bacterium]MCX7763663.1 hypothetical protein [Bacteroidia bacterium]MDW8057774.1 hypothetical protein [Bacteroidia bacterium]
MLNLYSIKFAYQLISRMDPSETRYFKRFSGFHGGDKIYMELFDKLRTHRRKGIPLKKIRSTLKKEEPHLETLVKHLNERLLESLTFYYETNSPEHRLAKSLRRAELLLYKGLIPLLPRVLLRIYNQALQEEKFAIAYQAVEMLKQLWGMNLIRGRGVRAEDLFRYTEKVLGYMNYLHKAWYAAALYAEVIIEEGESHPQEKLMVIDQYVARLGLEPPNPSDPLTLHVLYDTAQAIRARLYGDHEKYLQLTRLLVYKLEQKPKKLQSLQHRYLLALNNLLAGLTEKREYTEAHTVLEKIRRIHPTSRYIALQKERLLLFNELNIALVEGNSAQVAAAYESYLRRLEKTYLRTSPAYGISSYYLLAFHLYVAGENQKTLEVLRRVEEGAVELRRKDILIAALIVRLLTAAQSGDIALVRQSFRRAYRQIQRSRATTPVEKIFLEYLQRALRGEFKNIEAGLDAFAQYVKRIREVGEPALQRFWEVYFPTDWIEKKLLQYRAHLQAGAADRS